MIKTKITVPNNNVSKPLVGGILGVSLFAVSAVVGGLAIRIAGKPKHKLSSKDIIINDDTETVDETVDDNVEGNKEDIVGDDEADDIDVTEADDEETEDITDEEIS